MIVNCLAVGAGGFAGSVLRYLISLVPVANKSDIPWHTLAVNVIGAIFIGVIVGYSENTVSFDENIMLFLKVGVCGGFTTFYTFALETMGFMENGRHLAAIMYILASVILCVAGIYIGKKIV